MATEADSPFLSNRHVTSLPSGEASRALVKRLTKTCSGSRGSPMTQTGSPPVASNWGRPPPHARSPHSAAVAAPTRPAAPRLARGRVRPEPGRVRGEHRRVGGGPGEGGVALVRDARREDAERGQPLALGEGLLRADPIGDVVDEDDAAVRLPAEGRDRHAQVPLFIERVEETRLDRALAAVGRSGGGRHARGGGGGSRPTGRPPRPGPDPRRGPGRRSAGGPPSVA